MDELPHQEDTEAMVAQCLTSTANSDDDRPQGNTIKIKKAMDVSLSSDDEPIKDTSTADDTWDCHKCKKNNGGHRKRCQGCLGWRGGVRKNISRLKKSSEDDTNMQIEKEEYSFDKSGAVLPSSNEWEHEKYSTAQWYVNRDIPLLNMYTVLYFNIFSCTLYFFAAFSDMVWDSTLARNASTEMSLLESIVPHDRRESALRLFHNNKYKINGKKNIILNTHFIISLGIIIREIMF